MRKIYCLIFLSCFFANTYAQQSNSIYQSYEIYLGDTINRVDKAGEKQGRWIYFGKDKKGWVHRLFEHGQIVEEGQYINGKKHHVWKSYHHTSKLKSEITYVNDAPDGTAKFYNPDGKIILEGNLKDKNFTDDYYVFDASGNKIIRKAAPEPKSSYLDFRGIINKGGKPLEGVTVIVSRNDFDINEVNTATDGSFKLKLELNFEYILRFSKKGYNSQSLLVNAYTHNDYDTGIYYLNDWKVTMYDNFASAATTELFGFLLNKPSDKIYFNKHKKKFMADGGYIHLFKQEFTGISETTKLVLAKAAEDNKKLEIENLRIEAEKKAKEIEVLKQGQQLQEAVLKKKEIEIHAQQLEVEKQAGEAAINTKEKKIKELLLEQKQAELHKNQLEAQQKAKELERMALLKKMQDMQIAQQKQQINTTSGQLVEEKKQSELTNKELDVANREKKVKDIELKQNVLYMNFLLGGLGIVAVFSFFLVRNIRQKKKANELLVKQASEIELQKNQIEQKSKIIEQKNTETEQSILYAKRIQFAILPPVPEIQAHLANSFILYKPKDIVSGDFYFFSNQYAIDKKGASSVILAAVDCTGHGVPGAFMSMVGNEKLKDAVDVSHEPGKILQELNRGVKTALRQSGDANSTRDGMDLSVCAIPVALNEQNSIQIKYAGANRPLWIIKKNTNEVEEVKATKCAIGGLTEEYQVFEEHSVDLQKGDTFYLFSDGYADQFGGPSRKKLMTKKFKEILVSIQNLSMPKQQQYLDSFMEEWRGDNEQIDDILVIGVRV
jgi:serine phosphatase RsbU (regulator of sigma subunit)